MPESRRHGRKSSLSAHGETFRHCNGADMQIHIDTDFGGDIDDICALALLLNSSDIEMTGITTVAENGGMRAGQVVYTLDVAGRAGIPVKAGADNAGGFYPMELGLPS